METDRTAAGLALLKADIRADERRCILEFIAIARELAADAKSVETDRLNTLASAVEYLGHALEMMVNPTIKD